MVNAIRGIGAILMVYALSGPVMSLFVPLKTTPEWWATVASSFIVGLILVGSTFIRWGIPAMFKFTKSVSLKPSSLEDLDSDYMYHLAERAKYFKDFESLKLIRQLQDRFFANHHGDPNEKTDNSTIAGTVISN